MAIAIGAIFALVGVASLLSLALPASITSLGSIQALWWLAAALSLLLRGGRIVGLHHSEEA